MLPTKGLAMTVHRVEDCRLLDLYGVRMERVEFRGRSGELLCVEHRPITGVTPSTPAKPLFGTPSTGSLRNSGSVNQPVKLP